MPRLFGIEDLYKSEEETMLITRTYLQGTVDNFPIILDTFLKLSYFIGETEDVETSIGVYQSFCTTTYMQAPYTANVIYDLYERGYYLEGIVLCRHLLEAFIQMKYFQRYPDKIKDHIGGKRIRFVNMFDEFSEGYYKKFYGGQLSEAAHGMLFKDIFRFERKSPTEARTIMGCEFNAEFSSYLINTSVPIIFGFLNFFPSVYQKNTIYSDQEFKRAYDYSRLWLDEAMKSHMEANPKSEEWYKHINRFVY
ncbi:MAG: hypothetical protein PHV03_10120 [Desulfitobacteriaceae bacterium]|nr:hypothetical protein [Desulfitobacteriaceae bacterium]